MADEIQFRTWDIERRDIRARNIEKTLSILEAAGITPENPNYKRYYNATMINVNNAYRFSYNGETDAMLDKVLDDFSETIKDPNVSIDDYERVTKEFLQQRVSQQFQKADGGFGDDNPYEVTRGILNETIRTGMQMRKEFDTDYPPEFYTEGGSLQRLVMDIPLDMQAESAMRNIDMIVAKYKDNGIEFSSAENAFIVKGQKVGPEKFFTSKSTRLGNFLEKYENDSSILDLKDDELFGVLEKGNYEEFLELGRQRAMAVPRDKTNEALRAALKDEVIFHEICADGIKRDELVDKMKNLSDNFTKSAKLVSKESEKDVLGRVDRVMFSAVPEDLATQSTLRNWRSCMHATGCNHRFVDDTIGLGAIVAYGYDSQNPQKSVSRLLILPYKNEKGEVAYKVNDRIYGIDNTGFRRAVAGATKHFNEGKSGTFEFIEGFYNDNGGNMNITILRRDEQGRVILDDLIRDGKVVLNADLQSTILENDKIMVSDNVHVVLDHFKIPDGADFSQAQHVTFNKISGIGRDIKLPEVVSVNGDIPEGADLSSAGTLLLGSEVKFGKDLKLPETVVVLPDMTVGGHIPDGMDFSKVDKVTFDLDWVGSIGKDVKLPKTIGFTGDIPNGTDLTGAQKLLLGSKVRFGEDIKLPETVVASEYMEISGRIPDGADLSAAHDLSFQNVSHIGENVKFPESFSISVGSIPDGTDLSHSQHVSLDLNWIEYIGKDVKLPKVVSVNGSIRDGVDLSGAQTLLLGEHVDFDKNIKLPDNIIAAPEMTVGGHIPDGMDLSQVGHLTLHNIKSIGENVKFPEEANISGYVVNGLDLSGVKKLSLENYVDLGQNVKLPEQLETDKLLGISGYIPDGADFSAKEYLTLGDSTTPYPMVMFGQDVKLPENLSMPTQLRIGGHIPDNTDLSGCQFLTLENVASVGTGVKLPRDVNITGHIADGADLSAAEIGRLRGEITLGRDVKLPPDIGYSSDYSLKLNGHIPDGTNLTACEHLTLNGEVELGAGVSLPKGTKLQDAVISGEFPHCSEFEISGSSTFRDITVPADINLKDMMSYKDREKIQFTGACHFADGIELPSSMTFENAAVSGDLSSIQTGVTFVGKCRVETDKLPEEVSFKDAQVLDGNFSGKNLYIDGKTTFAESVKLSNHMSFTNSKIAADTQLTDMEYISIDNSTVGENVKISGSHHNEFNDVVFKSGCDLSECYKMRCEGACEFAEDIKYPPNISFSNATIKGDLSAAKSISLHDNIEILPETVLPPEVEIASYGEVSIKGDLSSAEHLVIGHSDKVDLSNVTGFPKKMTVEGRLPDGVDLSQVEQLTLTKEFSVGKDVQISENTEIILKNAAISKDFNMDQFKNVHFEGVIMAQDAESMTRLLQSDAPCIMVEKAHLPPDIKFPADKALMIIDEDGKPSTYIPNEERKKDFMTMFEMTDEDAFNKEVNMVSAEEISQKFGIQMIQPAAAAQEEQEDLGFFHSKEHREMFKFLPTNPTEYDRDIAQMTAITGTAEFSYNDIHNSGVDNAFHYDYKRVIDGVSKAKKIDATEAEKMLLEDGALRPLPDGEYMVDVGYSTRGGGGRNKSGDVFFTFSREDTHNRYHEMAHSFQKSDGLFDDAALDKMYAVAERGLQPGEDKTAKLADRESYRQHLKEVHADVFAQAALMLREENGVGFMKQALYAQSYGESRNAEGWLAGAIDQGLGEKAKMYACKPVMHAMIKEIAAIRRQGKRDEFFRPEGTLDAKKLSDLCEKITLQHAYSPRTYKSLQDSNVTDGHSPEEKGWRKGTALALVKMMPAKCVMAVHDGMRRLKKSVDKFKHAMLRREEISELKRRTSTRAKFNDPKTQAVRDYEFIQAKILITASKSPILNADENLRDMVGYMHKHEVTAEDLKKMSRHLNAPGVLKDLAQIHNIMQENKGNPHFQAIMDNPANFAELRKECEAKMRRDPMKELDEALAKNYMAPPGSRPTEEKPMTDKEKIAVLSGRSPEPRKTPTTPPAHEAPMAQRSPETGKAQSAPQKAEKQQATTIAQEGEVAHMSKKEKGKFFHNLRLGVNTILAKVEDGLSAIKGNSQTQTQSQTQNQTQSQTKIEGNIPPQINAAQIKMSQKSGDGR